LYRYGNKNYFRNWQFRYSNKSKRTQNYHSSETQKIIQDLSDTMRHQGLVGIAAPQIGIGSRIFLTEVRRTKNRKDITELDPLRVFVNPQIVSLSKRLVEGYEGCGSVAQGNLFGIVKRPETIVLQATDEYGEPFTLQTSGLLARIIQHEIDHLNGVCFIDKVSDTKTLLGRGEYLKTKKQNKSQK
jgi:peptide deformylase